MALENHSGNPQDPRSNGSGSRQDFRTGVRLPETLDKFRYVKCGVHSALVFLVLFRCQVRSEEPTAIGPLVVKLIDQVDVPALQSGPVRRLDVKLGEVVTEGQVIAQVEDHISTAQLELVENELSVSRQQLDTYLADRIAEADLREKQAARQQQQLLAKIASEKSNSKVRVSAAEMAEAVAKNEWARAAQAREKYVESVSQSELENLKLKFERSRLERIQAEFERRMDQLSSESEVKAVKVAEIAVERAELFVSTARADAEVLRLDVAAKKTSLQLSRLAVAQHKVIAPLGGVVVEIYKRRGEWVRPGDSVVRVINLDQLHAEGFLSGSVRPKRGRAVRLRAAGQEVPGTIDFVSSERDSVSGEFRFLVRLAGGTFIPGDRVKIDWQKQ